MNEAGLKCACVEMCCVASLLAFIDLRLDVKFPPEILMDFGALAASRDWHHIFFEI